MPRSSRSSAGARSAPSGSRGAHTMAAPAPTRAAAPPPPAAAAPHHPAPAQTYQAPAAPAQPGLFAQMASTAAGVAVGSTVGHGLSNMLFGGSGKSEAAAAPAEAQPPQTYNSASQYQQQVPAQCEVQSKDFVKCLEATNDLNSCSYYLEQLKACQAAASPY